MTGQWFRFVFIFKEYNDPEMGLSNAGEMESTGKFPCVTPEE